VVKDAEQLAQLEDLSVLAGPLKKKEDLSCVVVCISEGIDLRKKFFKQLSEKAAWIECDEVKPEERESWVKFLAQRKGLGSPGGLVVDALLKLEPWSLELVDQELEKMKIAWEGGIRADEELSRVLTAGLGGESAGSRFVQSFFSRELKGSLEWIAFFARSPEEALPLLGLMAWNARQLEIFLGLEGRNKRNNRTSCSMI
jgi:DNA polymerase III delta subunit